MRNTLCEFLTFADSRRMPMQASVHGSLSARKLKNCHIFFFLHKRRYGNFLWKIFSQKDCTIDDVLCILL